MKLKGEKSGVPCAFSHGPKPVASTGRRRAVWHHHGPSVRVPLNRAPMTFSWAVRLKYGVLGGLAGWLAGWLMTFPFVLRHAWRYVDAHASQMPVVVAKGMVVWGAFSLLMASAGFVPLVLFFLLISPRWIVRRRRFLLPGVTLAAILAFYYRMGLLHSYHFRHWRTILIFFFTAPNFFSIIFALVMMWVYVVLARRRLSAPLRHPLAGIFPKV